MFIPGIFCLMVGIIAICMTIIDMEKNSWRELAVGCAVLTPLYPLFVILISIETAVKTLRGKVDEEDIEFTKENKLIEIIGE